MLLILSYIILYYICHILGKKQDQLVEMLEAEEDFKSSQTLLEERLALKGARLIFLPKFHPEFAPIECVYRYIYSHESCAGARSLLINSQNF